MFFGVPEACIIGKRLPVHSLLFTLEGFNNFAITPQSSNCNISSVFQPELLGGRLVSLFVNWTVKR